MGDDEEFELKKAFVRMPKGQRLADSSKTEGWSRGFTPKTSERGPEHVEIRFADEEEDEPYSGPQTDFVSEETAPAVNQTTFGQEMALILVDGAKEIFIAWWNAGGREITGEKANKFWKRAVERKAALAAARVQWKAMRAERKMARSQEGAGLTVEGQGDSATSAVTAPGDDPVRLTADEYGRAFSAWVHLAETQRQLLDVLMCAEVRDADPAMIQWQQQMRLLPPERQMDHLQQFLGNGGASLITSLLAEQLEVDGELVITAAAADASESTIAQDQA